MLLKLLMHERIRSNELERIRERNLEQEFQQEMDWWDKELERYIESKNQINDFDCDDTRVMGWLDTEVVQMINFCV